METFSISVEIANINDTEKILNKIIADGFELCETKFNYDEDGHVIIRIDVKAEQWASIENCIKEITTYGKILEFIAL